MKIHGIIYNTTEFNIKEKSLPFYIKIKYEQQINSYSIHFYDSIYNKHFAKVSWGHSKIIFTYTYVYSDQISNFVPTTFDNLQQALSYLSYRFQIDSVDKIYDELNSIKLLEELSE